MQIEGKVTVVTGGASGIGLAMAREFASAGARVVVLDVEEDPLVAAVAELRRAGHQAWGRRVDVRRRGSLAAIARSIADELGGTDILCNNAGVLAAPGRIWDAPRDDTEWMFAVNFWGALNGVQAFVPLMIERGSSAHIVNTSSVAALAPQAGVSSYLMSKAANIMMAETLQADLAAVGAPIGVSVVLPEQCRTRLGSSHRNRASTNEPGRTWGPIWDEAEDPVLMTGADPRIIGQRVVEAVRHGRFWVLPPATDESAGEAMKRLSAIECSFTF